MIPVPQLDRATRVSVVVPVYRSAPTLAILCTRLRATLQPLFDHYEILLVDDRSPDQAWEAILGLQRDYPEVKGVRSQPKLRPADRDFPPVWPRRGAAMPW